MKKKKARVGSGIKSLNETPDELCLKAEATGKLAFLTQANSLKKPQRKKCYSLADLEANINAALKSSNNGNNLNIFKRFVIVFLVILGQIVIKLSP